MASAKVLPAKPEPSTAHRNRWVEDVMPAGPFGTLQTLRFVERAVRWVGPPWSSTASADEHRKDFFDDVMAYAVQDFGEIGDRARVIGEKTEPGANLQVRIGRRGEDAVLLRKSLQHQSVLH